MHKLIKFVGQQPYFYKVIAGAVSKLSCDSMHAESTNQGSVNLLKPN
jgi:hypothetical protein